MACKRYQFVVEGSGHFPIDMLRYDACWPATQEDVCRMDIAAVGGKVMPPVKVRITSHQPPTPERWASFGWRVIIQGKPEKL